MAIRSAILGIYLATSAAATSMAQAPSTPDAVLANLGLEAEKTRYVFADAEGELRQLYLDAVAAREEARRALAGIEGVESMQRGIMELQAAEEQLRAEIANARSAADGMRGGRNRASRFYRNQANAEIRRGLREAEQIRRQAALAKKQLPDEKRRQAAEGGARMALGRAQEAAKRVNAAYDALVERYQEVREKPGVLKALEDAGRPKKFSYQLGPSEEADKIGKWAKGVLKIRAKRPTAPARKADAPKADPKAPG
jgi:hypothetical protein